MASILVRWKIRSRGRTSSGSLNYCGHSHSLTSSDSILSRYPSLDYAGPRLGTYVHPQDCCYGIVTAEPYELHLQYHNYNLLLVFLSLTGLILFLLAPFLSRSTLAHYTVWASLGIFFSFLCLTFLLQKRFRQSFFSWVFLAYTLSLYLMSSTLYSISPTTLPWVGGYCLVTGIISCAVLYRIGPPSHPRTLSLIQWAIQAASLVMVAMSSYNTMASITVTMSIVMLSSAVPVRSLCSWVDSLGRISRRVRTEFITQAQVQEQSHRETRLALDQLRR